MTYDLQVVYTYDLLYGALVIRHLVRTSYMVHFMYT